MSERNPFSGDADAAWLALRTEAIIDPALPIVDPHHHLWVREGNTYLLPELLADLGSGHNLVATVFAECHSMYRPDGPPELRSLGETEFVTGIAAMSASGTFGPARACAAMFGNADLTLGARVEPVLEAHLKASGGRFRGIRFSTAWHPDEKVRSIAPRAAMLADPTWREGFARLGRLGLSFDAWIYHPQLSELADLAAAFPDVTIVLNHVGSPILGGPYAGRRDEVFAAWSAGIAGVARHPNVYVKLGALPIRLPGHGGGGRDTPPGSEEVAEACGPGSRPASSGSDRTARCSRAISRCRSAGAATRWSGTRSSASLPPRPPTRRPRCSPARRGAHTGWPEPYVRNVPPLTWIVCPVT